MTRDEAYNMMQSGYLVSHKLFGPGEYLYMTSEFFIKDEDNNDFESTWDVREEDPIWNSDWYVYKGNTAKKRQGIRTALDKKPKAMNLISHIQGQKCPGQDRCLQFREIAGAGACILCDVNDENRFIGYEQNLLETFQESIPEVYVESIEVETDVVKSNRRGLLLLIILGIGLSLSIILSFIIVFFGGIF